MGERRGGDHSKKRSRADTPAGMPARSSMRGGPLRLLPSPRCAQSHKSNAQKQQRSGLRDCGKGAFFHYVTPDYIEGICIVVPVPIPLVRVKREIILTAIPIVWLPFTPIREAPAFRGNPVPPLVLGRSYRLLIAP
jgi:hypothetical protein